MRSTPYVLMKKVKQFQFHLSFSSGYMLFNIHNMYLFKEKAAYLVYVKRKIIIITIEYNIQNSAWSTRVTVGVRREDFNIDTYGINTLW